MQKCTSMHVWLTYTYIYIYCIYMYIVTWCMLLSSQYRQKLLPTNTTILKPFKLFTTTQNQSARSYHQRYNDCHSVNEVAYTITTIIPLFIYRFHNSTSTAESCIPLRRCYLITITIPRRIAVAAHQYHEHTSGKYIQEKLGQASCWYSED